MYSLEILQISITWNVLVQFLDRSLYDSAINAGVFHTPYPSESFIGKSESDHPSVLVLVRVQECQPSASSFIKLFCLQPIASPVPCLSY